MSPIFYISSPQKLTAMRILVLLLLLFPVFLFSQNFDWFKTVGDLGHDAGQWVETDANGNIYVAGIGRGTCNFDGHVLASVDPYYFVAKYNSNGVNTWVTQIPFMTGYLFEMRDFKVTPEGDTYIVGDVNTNGSMYGMLVKVDSGGTIIKQTTPSQAINVTSISFDSLGNYYLGGISSAQPFVSKFSANDVQSWKVSFAVTADSYDNVSVGVTADSGLLFSFLFKNTVTVIDHATGSIQLNATQGILDIDRVIAKYNSSGSLVWAKKFDDKKPGRQIVVDHNTSNFYLLAHGEQTIDHDYLLRFDSVAVQVWSNDVYYQTYPLGWWPHIRLHGSSVFFIGGNLSIDVGGHSLGFFALKRFDLDGNLTGQMIPPNDVSPILGDIAFTNGSMLLVGGTYGGIWGNQTVTVAGTDYADYFLAKLAESNLDGANGVPAIVDANALQFYPNPVKDQLYIFNTGKVNGTFTISDIQGNVLSTIPLNESSLQMLSANALASGIYILTSRTNGTTISKKFVKE